MTTKKEITKPCKRICRYQFNDKEKLVIGKELAETTTALSTIEGDKKRIVADFQAKLAAKEAEVQSLSNKLTSGYEHREMSCTQTFNDPKPGKKTIRRDDTLESVAVENMTQDDLQCKLPIEGEPTE